MARQQLANQRIVVTLGGFGFAYSEVPDFVKFGMKEQMNIHKIIGGARVIDMLGDDPEDFTWSGTFLGADSYTRAMDLQAVQTEKQLVDLTFGSVNRTVVISSLDVVYKRDYRIDYTITCVVIDLAAGTGGNNTAGGNAIDDAGVAAGGNQVDNANVNLNGAATPTDAGNALNQGVAGQGATLEAGGFDTGGGLTFA